MRYFRVLFYSFVEILHLYLAWNLFRAFRGKWWSYLLFAVGLLPLAGVYFRSSVRQYIPAYWVSQGLYLWFGLLMLVCIFLMFRDAIHLILYIVDKIRKTNHRRFFSTKRSIRIAFCFGILGFFYALHEANAITIQPLLIKTTKLPEGVDRVRIAVLTDLHLIQQTPDRDIENIVNLTNDQQPDYIVLVGDYVDGRLDADGREARLLRQLSAKGKFAVNGNHELYRGLDQAMAFVQSAGFTLLRGESVELPELVVAGVDDPQIPGRKEIVETLAEIDTDKFVLLLSHRPEAPEGAVGKFDLEVAGHTHGGQVWPARYIVYFFHGFFRQGLTSFSSPEGGRSQVYVSNGTRFWGPPVRFLTPPEITIVDVERE